MSPWSHLPNAAHIDRVISSLKTHPEIWAETWDEVYDVAHTAVYDAAHSAVYNASRDEVYDAAWSAAYDTAWGSARDAAWDAILALIAYDDAAKYLNMTSDKLRVWGMLGEKHEYVLLLPAVIAFERISELEAA